MSNTNKQIDEPLDFGDYLLVNHEKYDRAVNGVVGAGGSLTGGVGADAPVEAILAEYDRLGGLVKLKDGTLVETGTFYDFKKRAPKTDIEIHAKEKPNKKGVMHATVENTSGPSGSHEIEDDGRPRRGRRPKSPADDE